MNRVVTAQQMRDCDAACVAAGTSVVQLMERAAAALKEELISRYGHASYAFFCGKGNNGGDGLACASLLWAEGYRVEVYGYDDLSGAPLVMRDKLYAAGGEIRPLASFEYTSAEVLVDCLYGTGLSRPLSQGDVLLIHRLNALPGAKVACDIPTGLHADSGQIMGAAFQAQLTVSFQALKYGQLFGDGVDLCGELAVKDIGIPLPADAAEITDAALVRKCFPERRRNSHKGTYGRVTIVAGSNRYFGAALIAENACAALRMGCGYATLAVPASLLPIYQQRIAVSTLQPLNDRRGELAFCDGDVEKLLASDVIVFGMGLGISQDIGAWVQALLERYRGKLLLDADGINSLAAFGSPDLLEKAKCTVCLTPHVKEFSRLTGIATGEILSCPRRYAQEFALTYGVNLLLKGTTTIITDGQRVLLNTMGSPALAKAGSGDVLSGAAGALLAREQPLEALSAAAYLHGLAGIRCGERLGEYSVLATDLCTALKELSEEDL